MIVAALLVYHHRHHLWRPIFGVDQDLAHSSLFTIPIIDRLDANLSKIQTTIYPLWNALKDIPAHFTEVRRLQEHAVKTRVSIQSIRPVAEPGREWIRHHRL